MFLIWYYIEKFKALSKTKYGMFCLAFIFIGSVTVLGECSDGIHDLVSGLIAILALVVTLFLIAVVIIELLRS